MDVKLLQNELEQLQKEKAEVKQRLDAFRPGMRGLPGARPGLGPRSDGPSPAADGQQRWGAPLRNGSRAGSDGLGPRGGGVFARLSGGGLLARQPSGPLQGRDSGQGTAPLGRAPSTQLEGRAFLDGAAGDAPAPDLPPPPLPRGPPRIFSDHDDRDGRGRVRREVPPWEADPVPLAPPQAGRRKLLSSAVVVNAAPERAVGDVSGDATHGKAAGLRPESEQRWDGGGAAARKRPAEVEEPEGEAAVAPDPNTRKRNRRMFGALLGTLQRFRDEDAVFQDSGVAAKREAALRKAEARERLHSEQLRRAAAEKRAAARDEELARLGELSLAADTKLLELIYAARIARKVELSRCFVTAAGPPIYWAPAQPSPDTDRLAASQRQQLEEWKAQLMAELEAEKEGLAARSAARRDAALARRTAREERIAAARAAGDAALLAAAQLPTMEDLEADRAAEAGEYGELQGDGDRQVDTVLGSAPMDTDEVGAYITTGAAPGRPSWRARGRAVVKAPGPGQAGGAEDPGDGAGDVEEEDDLDLGAAAPDRDRDANTVEDLLS